VRIVVPVKPLAEAKSRLSSALSASERVLLMGWLLDRVLDAALAVAPVSVVTADKAVAARAARAGAAVIVETEPMGLDAAARLATAALRRVGESGMLLLPADLPDITAQALAAATALWRPGNAVIVASRDGGTNALAVAPDVDFPFAYGPDSFARHCSFARRSGLVVIAPECPALSRDIDRPDDLDGRPWPWAA
jgi:2-phospho-L-lactate guanylyltransferase